MLHIQRKHWCGIKIIHRDIKKPLNLRCVQIKGQNTFDASFGDKISDQLGGNWRAGLGTSILAGISEIGNNGRDAPS